MISKYIYALTLARNHISAVSLVVINDSLGIQILDYMFIMVIIHINMDWDVDIRPLHMKVILTFYTTGIYIRIITITLTITR
eukprot:gene16646-19778_t